MALWNPFLWIMTTRLFGMSIFGVKNTLRLAPEKPRRHWCKSCGLHPLLCSLYGGMFCGCFGPVDSETAIKEVIIAKFELAMPEILPGTEMTRLASPLELFHMLSDRTKWGPMWNFKCSKGTVGRNVLVRCQILKVYALPRDIRSDFSLGVRVCELLSRAILYSNGFTC